MPKKRATRVNKHAKPKQPDGEITGNLDAEERMQKLNTFLRDFDIEVGNRLKHIEKTKERLQSMVDKQINLQLNFLPMSIRNMNIMDFIEAGGTVESALEKLEEAGEGDSFVDADFGRTQFAQKKRQGTRKGKGSSNKNMGAPPSTAKSTAKKRSRFMTPATRQLPAVWDTPAVTPKFDVNLPFTPGLARAPKFGERLMSLAGSPVDVSNTQKVSRTLKHTRTKDEDEIEDAVSRVAAAVPGIAKQDIHKILAEFSAVKASVR